MLTRIILLLCCPSIVLSHGNISERIHQLEHDSQYEGNAKALHIERAKVYTDESQYEKSLSELENALALSPCDRDALYWQAKTLLKQGDLIKAKTYFSSIVDRTPNSYRANKDYAKTLFKLGDFTESADYYDRTIKLNREASLEVYRERIQVLGEISPLPIDRIQRSVNEAIAEYGSLVSILSLSVDLYIKSKQYDNAILTINQLPQKLINTPEWLVKRGHIRRAQRMNSASAALYTQAITQINLMPHYKHNLPIYNDIFKEAQHALVMLDKGVNE